MRGDKTTRVLMVIENCSYFRDARVRKEAEALMVAGYGVCVVCPGRMGESWYEEVGTIRVYRFPLWSLASNTLGYLHEYICATVLIMLLSVLVLFRDGFDIIHVANPPDCIVPIMSIYKLLGKLVIYDQHDLCPELHAAKFGQRAYVSRLLLALEQYSYRLADHVIVTNESYKEISQRRGRVPESKVTVVRNGPNLPSFEAVGVDAQLRAKSPNIIAFAGVIGSQDGLDYLCRALHHLRYEMRQEDFYCIVVGDGGALREIKALAQELRLDDKIWFAGWISDPDAYARYIATADICVAPDPSNSYSNRSTFVKIMEYMAASRPIVAFDLVETRYSAQTAALYAHPNDVVSFAQKLADLMTNPSLRHSMGESGYLRIRNELEWQYSARRLLSVYKGVVESSVAAWRVPSRKEHTDSENRLRGYAREEAGCANTRREPISGRETSRVTVNATRNLAE
jgi:glycosyltransferase involved in cell wall biosynthesis